MTDPTSSLPMISSKAASRPEAAQDSLDVLTPGAGDDSQPNAAAELPDQFLDAGINPGRVTEHADRERLLLAHPAVDVAVGDLLDRQQVAEELPVVHVGRSGRDLVGNLPAQGRERPLPGRDMMVLGVGDHSVKIQ